MHTIRCRVRAVAVVWLLSQAASLAAFGPDHCCIAHTEEAEAKASTAACHEAEPKPPEPGDACPIHHADGAACPMKSSKSGGGCAMSNGCDGPGTQLAHLLSFLATPELPELSSVVLLTSPAFVAPPSPLPLRFAPPDAPPPKA